MANKIKKGDKKMAACRTCSKGVTVTYELRDVPFSDGPGIVKNVRAGVCNNCGTICVLPQLWALLDKGEESVYTAL